MTTQSEYLQLGGESDVAARGKFCFQEREKYLGIVMLYTYVQDKSTKENESRIRSERVRQDGLVSRKRQTT